MSQRVLRCFVFRIHFLVNDSSFAEIPRMELCMNQKSKITSTVSHLLQGEHLPSTKLKHQDKKVETLGHPRKCKLLRQQSCERLWVVHHHCVFIVFLFSHVHELQYQYANVPRRELRPSFDWTSLETFEKHLLRYFVDANMMYFEFPPASIQEPSPE
jgi:hypothetical protein